MTKSMTNKRAWGDWTLSSSTYELFYRNGQYHVDLERCCDSAQVLDWIQHIAGKSFAHKDPKCIFDLVCALKDLLEIPKGYCEWGMSKSGSVDVRSRIDGFDKRQEELERFAERMNVGPKLKLVDAS
jgi:hypothetical protein